MPYIAIAILTEFAGVQSENSADWTTYRFADLIPSKKVRIERVAGPRVTDGGEENVHTISVSRSEWLGNPTTRVISTVHMNEIGDELQYHCVIVDVVEDQLVRSYMGGIFMPRGCILFPSVPTSGRAIILLGCGDAYIYTALLNGEQRVPFAAPARIINTSSWANAWVLGQAHINAQGAMVVAAIADKMYIMRYD